MAIPPSWYQPHGTQRVLPNDVPLRLSYGRKGTIAVVLDDNNYYLDWGRGEAELGFWHGTTGWALNDKVYAVWAHDAGTWWIEGEAQA